jgi:hypothetical protein
VREVEHAIFYPAGLRAIVLLAESGIDASPALLRFLSEGILLAFRLCLTSSAAVLHTVNIGFDLIAKVVPFRFFAGHHLGQDVFFEHITVCQYI